jgi:molybdopterin synthase catalytic subunit
MIHVAVTSQEISHDDVRRRIRDTRAGAEVVFTGVTREVDMLEYEAYAEMAEQMMRDICVRVSLELGLCRVAAVHRVGSVELSGPCVVVAVSAPHREEAFVGARRIIDEIKATAPIWKVEIAGDDRGRPDGATPHTATS